MRQIRQHPRPFDTEGRAVAPKRWAGTSLRPVSPAWERTFALLAFLVVAGIFGLQALDRHYPPPMERAAPSPVVVDQNGALLRAFTDPNGRWRLPVRLEEVDPHFIDFLIAFEDKRFRTHQGVDPRAALRALWQAATSGRVVSGASTLTMQTVRLLTADRRRSLVRKGVEAVRAAQLERRLSKAEILDIYLNAAPYGGNIEGVRAASLAYFGREPARLTLAQAALLIALPQSPEARRPDRRPEAARKARDRVIDRLASAGIVTPRDALEAKREAVPTRRRAFPQLAPHLARQLAREAPGSRVITTTLERDWQAALQRLAAERVSLIGPRLSAGIVVADLATGKVRASVGSARFLEDARAGHVDMVHAIRSPGSTLKPFIYGLAMEAGFIAAGTMMEDRPLTFAGYEPENFDDTFRGRVTAAEALKQSLNVPAITLLDAIGAVRLAVRLQEAGAALALPENKTATLAIGLGGLGTSLFDLAELYTGLAREGRPVALFASGNPPKRPSRLLEARAAKEVAAILATMRPPRNARPGLIAYKTGTSYGHRDAWAVGFDNRHVIAVWLGRPDGTPVAQLTGWTDAAPLLFDAFSRIGIAPLRAPSSAVPTAELPPPLRQFIPRAATGRKAHKEIAIAFPPQDARVALTQPDGQRVPLTARVLGKPVDTWLINGRPLDIPGRRRSAQIELNPGAYTLTVVTSDGVSERVDFSVE